MPLGQSAQFYSVLLKSQVGAEKNGAEAMGI